MGVARRVACRYCVETAYGPRARTPCCWRAASLRWTAAVNRVNFACCAVAQTVVACPDIWLDNVATATFQVGGHANCPVTDRNGLAKLSTSPTRVLKWGASDFDDAPCMVAHRRPHAIGGGRPMFHRTRAGTAGFHVRVPTAIRTEQPRVVSPRTCSSGRVAA
jgi:hypothetical protein